MGSVNHSKTARSGRFTFVLSAILVGSISGCGGGLEEPLAAHEVQQPLQAEASSVVPEDDEAANAATVSTVPVVDKTADSGRRSALGVTAFTGGPYAHTKGKFGPLHDWPVIPIAMVLTPDGRVLAYGSDLTGKQGASMHYTVWNPEEGTGLDAFLTLPNTTETDIFCAGQALMPGTGRTLIVGGDAWVGKQRNYANDEVNIFDPKTNKMSQTTPMEYRRWYATVVTLANGTHVALGGHMDKKFAGSTTDPATVATYPPAPEVRAGNGSWETLSTAASDTAYGWIGNSWFYPRAWVNPQGGVFILTYAGPMYNLNTAGTGTLAKYTVKTAEGEPNLTSVMFAPGRVLSVRKAREAVVVDFSNPGEPVVTAAGHLAKDRQYGNSTVLADGRVWVNGGSSSGNTVAGMALDSELWNPDTNKWTTTASATVARLYHSTSILLLDGRVLTGGGGAVGPLTNLNGEIYYPPYLFNADANGTLAVQPVITYAPGAVIGWDKNFSVTANEKITKVTLVRAGVATHNFNGETRFFNLPVSNPGPTVTVRSPETANLAPPGFYMLFAWNADGVPSVAKMVRIGA